ncbi:MAG: immunoglobulin domain-containing protein, partial [Kiritimatiellia bacterium]|nr:immunoglobulin domain-containing protein [Kiritimatiellia bacterium]
MNRTHWNRATCRFGLLVSLSFLRFVTAAPPVITVAPASVSVRPWENAVFSVTATGATSYQWMMNGSPLAGATSSSVTLPSVEAMDDGAELHAVVSNGDGSTASAMAVLTVRRQTWQTFIPFWFSNSLADELALLEAGSLPNA